MRVGTMFPPKTDDKYHVLTEDELIAGVTQYVSKNSQLKKIFKACEDNLEDDAGKHHQDNLALLLDAINKPDYFADIFKHPFCSEYVIYLMQQKKISFNLGYDVYVHLMSLAQFTELRNIKPEDEDIKSIRPVAIKRLITDNQLTEFGAEYLRNMVLDLREYGIDLDIAEMQIMLMSLPPFSQAVIQFAMTSFDDDRNPDVSKGFHNSKANCPLFADSKAEKFNLPLSDLRNYFYSKMNDKPLQEKPILGSVGENTLFELHEKGQHPVLLYSMLVKLYVKSVHGRVRGLVPVLLHDLVHMFGANLLPPHERTFIQESLIPMLRTVPSDNNSPILKKLIEKLVFELTDFEFVFVRFFLNKETRLQKYLDKTFNKLEKIYGEILVEAAKDDNQKVKQLTHDDVEILIKGLTDFANSPVLKKYGISPAVIDGQVEKIKALVSSRQTNKPKPTQ